MNRREMQEWLEQFPEDTEIEVVVVEAGTGWHGDTNSVVAFTGEECEFVDFRGNQFVKEDSPHFNKKFLHLGEPR